MVEFGSERQYYIFLLGAAVGTALGLTFASITGWHSGRTGFATLRSMLSRLLRRQEGVRFEMLLQ
ncbi:MAG: hypothetical protein M1319_01560 [Chloroflexi bacterium]|nr:hypothetical protein [Chloroflexota bacterium]